MSNLRLTERDFHLAWAFYGKKNEDHIKNLAHRVLVDGELVRDVKATAISDHCLCGVGSARLGKVIRDIYGEIFSCVP